MNRLMKSVFLILILLCLGFVGFSITHGVQNNKVISNKSEIKVVRKGDLEVTISGTGYVSPNLSVEIKCKASGEVRKLPFDVSDYVSKGDLLLELDPIDEDNNVRKAEVDLLVVESRLSQAKHNIKVAEKSLQVNRDKANANLKKMKALALNEEAKASRLKTLLAKKLVSLEDWQNAKTLAINASCEEDQAIIEIENLEVEKLGLEVKRQDVMIAKAEVEAKKINLFIAKQRLKETKIISPMNGFVSARNVQNGQIVSSGINNV